MLFNSDIVGLLEQKNISILQTLHIAKYQANGEIKNKEEMTKIEQSIFFAVDF